jgi:hypothetical protein
MLGQRAKSMKRDQRGDDETAHLVQLGAEFETRELHGMANRNA